MHEYRDILLTQELFSDFLVEGAQASFPGLPDFEHAPAAAKVAERREKDWQEDLEERERHDARAAKDQQNDGSEKLLGYGHIGSTLS